MALINRSFPIADQPIISVVPNEYMCGAMIPENGTGFRLHNQEYLPDSQRRKHAPTYECLLVHYHPWKVAQYLSWYHVANHLPYLQRYFQRAQWKSIPVSNPNASPKQKAETAPPSKKVEFRRKLSKGPLPLPPPSKQIPPSKHTSPSHKQPKPLLRSDTIIRDIALAISPGTQLSVAVPGNASLVVIGAHHFGDDTNDPLYSTVSGGAWSDVLLVEASPPVAAELRAKVAERNPTPNVPQDRLHVVNQGVCPGGKDQQMPFYSFLGAPGLPFWATQIGSFNRSHVEKHLGLLARNKKSTVVYKVEELRSKISVKPVLCTSLLSLLQRQRIQRMAVLLIDTEGLDCDLVASQDWSSPEWCGSLSPGLLVFEWKHCSSASYDRAITSLKRRKQCHVEPGSEHVLPFRHVLELTENAFFTKAPRKLFSG